MHEIPTQDCLFVLSRKYEGESSAVACVRLQMGYEDFPFTLRLNKVWAAHYRFSQWWHRTMPEQYNLYLPHQLMPSYQMMAGERRCASVRYMEEGLAAYYTNSEYAEMFARPVNWREKIVSTCGYFGKVRRRFDMYPDGRECYGLTTNSFPESTRVKVLTPPALIPLAPDDPSIIIAPKPRLGKIWGEPQVADLSRGLIEFCRRRHITEVGIKPHPGEYSTTALSARIKKQLEMAGISVKQICQSSWLENHLMRSESTVITMGSSIELYGPNFRGAIAYGGLLLSCRQEFCAEYLRSMPQAARPLVARQLAVAAKILGLE
ncbi:MAG: hypothetical protein IPK27_04170 [Rhodanobacteraceae bacterium]|nr:hypothetical protein [Rhodanobacteraceae bacterium]